MKKDIRVSEPSAEMQEKIKRRVMPLQIRKCDGEMPLLWA